MGGGFSTGWRNDLESRLTLDTCVRVHVLLTGPCGRRHGTSAQCERFPPGEALLLPISYWEILRSRLERTQRGSAVAGNELVVQLAPLQLLHWRTYTGSSKSAHGDGGSPRHTGYGHHLASTGKTYTELSLHVSCTTLPSIPHRICDTEILIRSHSLPCRSLLRSKSALVNHDKAAVRRPIAAQVQD